MNTDNQAQANPNLAPVYLDNKPIALKDARPKVSAILSAMGKPETTDVKWLQFQPNSQGKALRSEEVLDRTTDPSKPIYLTSNAKGAGASGQGAGWKGKEAAAGGLAPAIAPAFGGGSGTGGTDPAHKQAGSAQGAKGEKALRADQDDSDAAGMRDDAEVGGESGRTATTDE